MWGGSGVMPGSFRGSLSWGEGRELLWGRGLDGLCDLLWDMSGEVGRVMGALFWVELVVFILVVLRVRGYPNIPFSLLDSSRTRRVICACSSPVRTHLGWEHDSASA